MANTLNVCLLAVVFCCANLSLARQVPKECSKGPSYWCQSLKIASDCGAVGHCSATVWGKQTEQVTENYVASRFTHLFRALKDVKDLINEDYLASRIVTACHDVPNPTVATICKHNTAGLEKYIIHVLKSDATPETMCRIVGMCNNDKVNTAILAEKSKTSAPSMEIKPQLLGGARCTWGPSYWCSNFSTSHQCKATKHCATRVWSRNNYPHDNDSICQICTDMVKQARDQLQSNETQEELKEVFEGSCALIPIKIVRKECMKLADDFVPELVETLASEMNPQTVCSVAGLCNNAKIDDMLIEYNARLKLREGCNNCSRTVIALRNKFDKTSYDDFLHGLLKMCRNAGSLSDSCSMLVFKYYENILAAVKKDLTADSVCHVSGQCAYKYHQHDQFDFPVVTADNVQDDVPCEFCEQLVKHLRDTLVANTTELEFYKVLKGLCKQTGQFKAECLHLAEQYYPMIYNFLTTELKPDEICSYMGICHTSVDVPIAPLLPRELRVKAIKENNRLIGADDNVAWKLPSQPPQLPIERMFVSVQPSSEQGKAKCSFCQYFLHYLQVELSDTTTIDKVTEAIDKACDRLPKAVNGECRQFVEQYGPAVVALLVQEIDPASVCPALGLCPAVEEVRKVDRNQLKSNCPLCLFAVEQLKAMINNTHNEENIRKALDNLCTHLSDKLKVNCQNFVDNYTQQLVEMLAADLDPQEVCVYLKLCTNDVHDPLKAVNPIDKYHIRPQLRGDHNNFRKPMLPTYMLAKDADIETNEIPDHTINGRHMSETKAPKTVCVLCEFVMKEIDDQIKDKHNEDEIKKVVRNVCQRMPKSVRGECAQFVDKYADLIISLLQQELEPAKVCEELKLCPKVDGLTAVREEILDCAVCETVVLAVKKVLSNDRVDRDIVHVIEKSCGMLPAKYSARCHTMMEVYGDSVIHLIEQFGIKGVCQKIGLCSDHDTAYVRMYREKRN